jgi:predicted nucleic acid-binding protein
LRFTVTLADANILIPRTLRDYVVYLGRSGAFDLHWSPSIFDEVARNLITRYGCTSEDVFVLRVRLAEYLPEALVEPGRIDLATAERVDMDPKDRHILAAALAANADVIVTDNIRHFPQAWPAERGIELLCARDLLTRIAANNPQELEWAHRMTVANSPKSEADILATLELAIGKTATDAVRAVVVRNKM